MPKSFSLNHSNGICGHRVMSKDHLVKFYENTHELTDIICDYVVPGISRADGIIIIATRKNAQAIEKALENRSIDVSRAKAAGQVVILDAEETLSLFMNNYLPDPSKFKSVIGHKIEKMLTKYSNIRAYGEMVNILWDQNNIEGTIELEKLWNNLSMTYPFALLCSYSYEEKLKKNGKAFKDICSTHSHYINTEGDFYKNNAFVH